MMSEEWLEGMRSFLPPFVRPIHSIPSPIVAFPPYPQSVCLFVHFPRYFILGMGSNGTVRPPPLPLLFQLFSPNNYSHSSASAAVPTMSAATVGDSSASPSVHSENIELRSRNTKTHGPVDGFTTSGGSGSRVPLLDHVVKNGESLMQISLQYSVPVSEIKRVNNIVADHEIYGLPLLRVPVTRAFLLRRQMMEAEEENGQREGKIIDILGEEGTSSSNNCGDTFDDAASDEKRAATHRNAYKELGNHRVQSNRQNAFRKTDFGSLLNDGQNDVLRGSDESLTGHAKEAIEGILDETDRNMETVRQNLPSPSLEGGAFHFVDAGAPDNSSNVWLIVAVVLVIFVLLPLALTFLEESGETEEHRQQRPTQ